jgi:transaldolase
MRIGHLLNFMNATHALHNLRQSLCLDNITRDLLNSGTLTSYIDDRSVTGLTSNPTIFDHALKNGTAYDAAICEAMPLNINVPPAKDPADK